MYEEHLKNFTNIYHKLSATYGNNVFADFVKMCAISIYNSFAKNQDMEKEYLNIINTYKTGEQEMFCKMFSELVMAYEESAQILDILGFFYEKENLGNGELGQFFTPSHISDFMAEINIEEDKLSKIIAEKGFISMAEPTCGAGRYDIIFRKSIKKA